MVAACDKCLWREQCLSDEVCEHYTPVDEDEYIDEMIEKGRYEFRKEWFAYISQDE
jgi:hypothetical protein